MIEPTYAAVAALGLLHGLEPGHGWPLAILYAVRDSRRTLRALVGSSVISFFHIISSLAAVLVYVVLRAFVPVSIPYVNVVAGLILLGFGVKLILTREGRDGDSHHHGHGGHGREGSPELIGLKGLATAAFVLGFAHEEEFVLLALAVGGIDPVGLMLAYSFSVSAGLIGVTIVAAQTYDRVEHRIKRYERYIPKVGGVVLLLISASFLLGLR